MKLIHFTQQHFPELMQIYKDGIDTGIATFETQIPTWEKWDAAHTTFGRLAVVNSDSILGWGALSPVSSRCVYGGVAEISVYVGDGSRGKGIGSFILNHLISESEKHNIWTLQSSIFRENVGSEFLHKKCGFRVIGYKEKVAKLNGEWKDNLLLERRSSIVGID